MLSKKGLNSIKIGMIVFFGLISVLTLLASLPRGPLRAFIVKSGSMRPAIFEGSVVFIKRGYKDLKINDIITFIKPDNYRENVTHRFISEVNKDGKTFFKTKGDANNVEDQWLLRREAIWGKVVLTLPLFGYLVSFSQTKIGVILVFVLPALLIIVSEIIAVIKIIKKKKRRNIRTTLLLSLWLLFSIINQTTSSFTHQVSAVNNQITAGCWSPPSVPVLVSPTNNTYAGLGSSWDLNPVMDWQDSDIYCPLNGAISYQYEVYSDLGLSNLLYRSSWLSSSSIFAAGTSNGIYYWRVRVKDSLDYTSSFSSAWKLVVDRISPTSSLDPLPPTTNQNPQDIGYSASDGSGSGIDYTDLCYSFNLSNWVCGNYFSFTFPLGEGTYYFDTIAYDLAGNAEKTVNHDPVYIATRPSVLFDITPPTTNLNVGTTTPKFTGQSLLTSTWTPDSTGGDQHQVDEPGRGTVTLLGNQSDLNPGTDSMYQNLTLPSHYSGALEFSYRFQSLDTAENDRFSVSLFDLSGVNLIKNILTEGNNTGALSYDTGWQSVSHSLSEMADSVFKLVFSVVDSGGGSGFNSYALVDDIKISTLDLRLGSTEPLTTVAADTGSGIATTTPPAVITVGETTVNYFSTDLAANIEATASSPVLVLPPVVLNKVDKSASKIWLYNNSDSAVDLTSFYLDLGTTQILSGTISASSSLDISFTSIPDSATAKLYGGSAVLVDSTTYSDLGSASWQRQSDGLGPWVKISAPLSFDLQSRLSVGKITLTISGLATTLADMSYTIDYSDTAGPQQIYGQISSDVIDHLGTTSRDFFLGTCSSGTCINATGIGTTFIVTFGGLVKTFTLN